jgi:hypothetical protein
MQRWTPPVEVNKDEQYILGRLKRTRKLFAFLRLHRHELFDDSFQEELEGVYRQTGAGEQPHPPALLCMVLLLMAYMGISDAEAVELSVMDVRWQLVLDCLGSRKPLYSQGAVQQFRERLIASDLDRRLLERTVQWARKTKEFDWKKLPKDLRVAVDSRPLEGAGRVEDTFNLLGHAARKLVEVAAAMTKCKPEQVCHQAGIPLLLNRSIKAGLDLDWNEPDQRDEAIEVLVKQVTSLHHWIEQQQIPMEGPLQLYVEAVAQVQQQDLEQTEDGHIRIRSGVAPDRRISIEDDQMRHGRKTKTKRFNGYKEHIAMDLDTDLILACAVTPANRPEEEAMPALKADLEHQNTTIAELSIDRAYINSPVVDELRAQGATVLCKPWKLRNAHPGMFSKADFKINLRDKTITCPAGQVEPFESGQVVQFDPEACGCCPLRSQCTMSASGKGRQVKISQDEPLQKKLRALQSTKSGRQRLRQRVGVEHGLAHISARKGPRARYLGTRKNLFDLRRTATVQNLEAIQRRIPVAHKAAA